MLTITRFAPSPTGYLHIGGARTALFNYLYAKHTKGKFLLRIEDTDIERSSTEAVEVILNGLKWLNLQHDDEIVYQLQNQEIHTQLAKELLNHGLAYKCYCTKEELEEKRKDAESRKQTFYYDGTCQKITDHSSYKNIPYTVRLKVDKLGATIINDAVLGKVQVENKTIDDFVILRSNGIATYMFAVVCDDHNMGITHVIRGDDHLTNTFKQYQIYKAFGWNIPTFAHIPLIHSEDGKKMSKRKGAISVDEYKNMGFLPEAIRNYLLRLGWSHKNDEIISDQEAISWFDIKDINKSSSRFDLIKLTNINYHYIKQCDNKRLLNLTLPFINKLSEGQIKIPQYLNYLEHAIDYLKIRSKTLVELAKNAMIFVVEIPFKLDQKALLFLKNNQDMIKQQIRLLEQTDEYTRDNLYNIIKNDALINNIKLADAVCGLRILLCGQMVFPASIFDIMQVLQKDETLRRINIIY